MVIAIAARDVLRKRLENVFKSENFSALYPGIKAPTVTFGFPVTEPPFYVAIDEVPEPIATEGGVTMGHAEVDFTLRVWAFAQHSSLEVASNTLLSYIDAVFAAIMADPQLNFTVDNAFPSVEQAGTATDSSRYYQAAAAIAIACARFSVCPAEMQAIIKREANNGD